MFFCTCFISRNTGGLTLSRRPIFSANTILVFLPAFSSLPSGPVPNAWCRFKSCTSCTQDTQQIQNHDENASGLPSCWMSEESWDHLNRICPTPLIMLYAILTGLVLRQHSTLQLNHPEECTAASSSFLTWALAGSTCIYIRLKSEAFFRLQCSMSTAYYWLSTNMHMWDPSPSSGCSELNLSRSKGAIFFEGTNLEILTAPVSKNNFHMVFHQKPFDTRPKAADSWGKSISGLKMCPIASSCATATCCCICSWHVRSKEASGWPLISGTLEFSTLSFLLSIHDRTDRWQTWIDIKLLTFKVEPAQLVDLRWDRFFSPISQPHHRWCRWFSHTILLVSFPGRKKSLNKHR